MLMVRRELNLDPDHRYDVGVIRVSTRDAAKLADQQDTGISVYDHLPDFRQLAQLPADPVERGWTPVRYSDLQAGERTTVFGSVGLVGGTVFVAAADSAVAANLAPDPGDPAQLGRNAFMDLLVAAAYAAQARNIYVPFRSRWWRHDLWANYLMEAINRGLPRCVLWEGRTAVATRGEGKLITSVEGRSAAGYAETFAEQVLEKEVQHLAAGEWGRSERELPFGLRRRRRPVASDRMALSLEVEEDPELRPVAVEALQRLARGDSYSSIGAYLAAEAVPMPGVRGKNKTFDDYATPRGRDEGTRTLLIGHLSYYETGRLTVRRSTKLDHDEARGIELNHDPNTGRRHLDVEVALPHRPFLSPREWAQVHERLDRETNEQNRRRGAAAHRRTPGELASALQGVTPWVQPDGREAKLAPETPTAYRWRARPPCDRGWRNGEGDVVATLRKAPFDHGLGRAILAALGQVQEPLAPHGPLIDEDPLGELTARVDELREGLDNARRKSVQADENAMEVEPGVDRAHWLEVGRTKRAEARDLAEDLAVREQELRSAADHLAEVTRTVETDATLPALVASLLIDGTGRVEPAVSQGLARLGITSTLRLTRDPHHESTVMATATATFPLFDGGRIEVPLRWECPDSRRTTGLAPVRAHVVRSWAAGLDYPEIAQLSPRLTPGQPGTSPGVEAYSSAMPDGSSAPSRRGPTCGTKASTPKRWHDSPGSTAPASAGSPASPACSPVPGTVTSPLDAARTRSAPTRHSPSTSPRPRPAPVLSAHAAGAPTASLRCSARPTTTPGTSTTRATARSEPHHRSIDLSLTATT